MFKFKSPLTEVDAIDEKIKGYCLAKHPEYFPMILKDLNLLRFWETLIKDPDVFVIQELAIDRAMNFYEGATCSGLEPAAVKIGVLCSIMTCVMTTDKNGNHLHTSDEFPLFIPNKQLKFTDYPFGSMTDEQIDLVKSVMAGISRGISNNTHNTINKKVPCMGEVFVDSLKMWVFGSERVKQLVAISEDRRELYPGIKERLPVVASQIRWASHTAFKRPPITHTLSLSRWGRIKLFQGNAISSLADIAKRVKHETENRIYY